MNESGGELQPARGLLGQRISDLPLKIEGTHLESLVSQLYAELEAAGISLRPQTYLSDEWGCPDGVPVIGIPFYLADRELCELEGRFTGIEAETPQEVMMYLRHEAGHAFNYAYRLYTRPGWQRLFGRFSRPYGEAYRTSPFGARYVRNIPGWYAQKHPDEDFAETFAVWLNPQSNWKSKYSGTGALEKLLYVGRLIARYGRRTPEVVADRPDRPVQDLDITLDNWYRSNLSISLATTPLPGVIDEDLSHLFADKEGVPAEDFLESHHRELVVQVNMWTGIERHVLRALINELIQRVKAGGLKVDSGQPNRSLIAFTAFVTTLAMNYQHTGQFVET